MKKIFCLLGVGRKSEHKADEAWGWRYLGCATFHSLDKVKRKEAIMVTITYKGKIKKIREAVASANELLQDPSFYADIKAKGEFDMADIPAELIAELIRHANTDMRLITYIGSPRVHGYDDRDNPDLIHVNIFRSEWTHSSIVNTIIHQMVHAVNDLHREFNFSHGDRNSDGKQNTAPFWIGNYAEERTEINQSIRRGMVHDAHPETLALDTLD